MTPRRRLHPRRIGMATVMVVAVLTIAAGVAWWIMRPTVHDPVHQGRRATEWFRELVRTADGQSDDKVALRHLEARIALTRMGTNAVPVLVQRALAADPDSSLRRLLRGVARQLPWIFPAGSFPPAGVRAAEALAILEQVRPAASEVFPQVAGALRGGAASRAQALRVLARTRDDGSVMSLALAELIRGLRVSPQLIQDIVGNLDRPPEISAADLASAAERPESELAAFGLLSHLGSPGRASVPALEQALAGTNDLLRLRAAFVLLEVAPNHAPARAVIERLASSAPFNPWNQVTQAATAQILREVGTLLRVTQPGSVEVIERLAREETEGWEPKGLAHSAGEALQRVAPERSVPMLLEQIRGTNRTNVRIVAAGLLLQVQRTNETAYRFLTNLATSGDHLARMAAVRLGEVDPGWVDAVRGMERLRADAGEPWIHSALGLSRKAIELRAVERALAGSPP